MSATTQFTTFSDLYTGLLKAVKSDQSAAATLEQAKRYINTALVDIHIGHAENVPWAVRDFSFSTVGTFASTVQSVGSTTTPGSNPNNITYTEFNFENADLNTFTAGHKIAVTTTALGASIGQEGELFNTSSANPAVVNVYNADLAANDTVRIYQNEVTLPNDFMRPAGTIVKVGTRNIYYTGRIEFRHKYAGDYSTGRPSDVTLFDTNDVFSGLDNRKLKFWPIPDTVERGHLSYVTKDLVVGADGEWKEEFSADTDEPIIPKRYRHVIFYHALYNWYRDRKDDTRSQEAKFEYEQVLTRIVNDTESSQSTMSIRPNTRAYRRKASRPYRSGRNSARRYDSGAFDRLE